ncbi:MAG: TPM domain-containing protein [Gemmatimonas sp.]
MDRWRQHRTHLLAIAMTIGGAAASLVSSPASLLAQLTPGMPLPSPVGYVNDFAGVLSADAKLRLETLARRVNTATRGDLVVVTLPDLAGRPVEEVALRLGREWKIGADAAVGADARNAGVVILVVPKESSSDARGQCRIETGQGAEGFITDGMSGAICRAALDRFVARDYSGAVEQVAGEVANRYAAAFGVDLDGVALPQGREMPQDRRATGSQIPFWVIILLFIVLPMILNSRRGRKSGCVGCIPIPIGGGGFGRGGFGGGGGGGFGGGGFGGGGFGGFGGGGGFSGGGGGSSW